MSEKTVRVVVRLHLTDEQRRAIAQAEGGKAGKATTARCAAYLYDEMMSHIEDLVNDLENPDA